MALIRDPIYQYFLKGFKGQPRDSEFRAQGLEDSLGESLAVRFRN